jgi:hypothetical protein
MTNDISSPPSSAWMPRLPLRGLRPFTSIFLYIFLFSGLFPLHNFSSCFGFYTHLPSLFAREVAKIISRHFHCICYSKLEDVLFCVGKTGGLHYTFARLRGRFLSSQTLTCLGQLTFEWSPKGGYWTSYVCFQPSVGGLRLASFGQLLRRNTSAYSSPIRLQLNPSS